MSKLQKVDGYYLRQARDFTDMLHDKGFLVDNLELKQLRALEEYLGYLLQSGAESARNIALLFDKPQGNKVGLVMNPNDKRIEEILLKYLRSHRRMHGLPVPAIDYGTSEANDIWTIKEATKELTKLIVEARIDETQKILYEAWDDRIKDPQAFIRNRIKELKSQL